MRSLQLAAVSPPGRFPTVIHDTSAWTAPLAGRSLASWSANAAFWRAVCSRATVEAVVKGWPSANDTKLASDAARARAALDALQTRETYASESSYVGVVASLAAFFDAFNASQTELELTAGFGPRVNGLDYRETVHYARFCERPSLLAKIIDQVLDAQTAELDVLLFTVTDPIDLLTAMLMIARLRARGRDVATVLADHGYENFSLHPHISKLKETGHLERFFDAIVTSKDERQVVVPLLVDAIASGRPVRGFVSKASFPLRAPPAPAGFVAPLRFECFAPEPLLWTRVSAKRCYWSRCTFCVQNAKYEDGKIPSKDEIPSVLDRLEALAKSGYTSFIFADEALSPPLLRELCEGIVARGLAIRWACRCKIELTHTRALFDLMHRAGCYEVLFGLESLAPRMQRLMDKYVEKLDAPRMKAILRDLDDAGIGVHLNFLANFPGDTVDEVRLTTDFAIDTLSTAHHGTFLLNEFGLFADTPIAAEPERFDVFTVEVGDLPFELDYAVGPSLEADADAVAEAIPKLRDEIITQLGWKPLIESPGGGLAFSLYSGSGHGAYFKSRRSEAFASGRRS